MNVAQKVAILLLRGYKLVISPALTCLFGARAGCRFEPTCSIYAMDAIRLHGFIRGFWLAICRLARCHPWGGAGYDPVPPAQKEHVACHCHSAKAQASCLRPQPEGQDANNINAGQDASCPQRC